MTTYLQGTVTGVDAQEGKPPRTTIMLAFKDFQTYVVIPLYMRVGTQAYVSISDEPPELK